MNNNSNVVVHLKYTFRINTSKKNILLYYMKFFLMINKEKNKFNLKILKNSFLHIAFYQSFIY